MVLKCELCKEKIEETFLGKIVGSYVIINGKKKVVCNSCQKKNKHFKDELL